MPTLYASVISHSTREGCGTGFTATFYYRLDGSGPELHQFPHIEVPCNSYEHARAVVDAFNAG